MNNVSFIDGVITNMTQSKSSNATLANLVQAQDHPHVGNRIAKAYNALCQERRRLQVIDKQDNTNLTKAMPVKPEQMLSFLQFTMNMTCWTARRLFKQTLAEAQERANEESAETMDFSSEMAAELGVEPVSIEGIAGQIETDFAYLNGVHSWLTAKGRIDYLEDVDPLMIYAESTKDEETGHWHVSAYAKDFDEALQLMDTAIDRMDEEKVAADAQSADETDFEDLAHVA